MESANRNLESFAYSVSHDLKASLRGISGYSRLLADDYAERLPGAARGYVESILDASLRMDRMIEDILAYSRVQVRELRPSRVDLVQLVDKILHEFSLELPDRVELVTEIEPGVLECDREGLSQILRNFVANAIKLSRASEPPRIRIEGRTTAAGYCFSVTDNGMGFDMRYHTAFSKSLSVYRIITTRADRASGWLWRHVRQNGWGAGCGRRARLDTAPLFSLS